MLESEIQNGTRFVGDMGFRNAGQMMGSAGMADVTGISDIAQGAGNALKMATAGTQIGSFASKAASIAPKLSEVTDTGIKGKIINSAVDKINGMSVGKVAKFLNPFDNPTTLLMGATSAQDKFDALKQMGYDNKKAMTNAIFTGYVNVVTEKMGYDGTLKSMFLLKGNPITGSSSASKLRNLGNVLKGYMSSNTSEALEEVYALGLERFGEFIQGIGYVDKEGKIRQRKFFGKDGVIDISARRCLKSLKGKSRLQMTVI
ncbi:MAG: hypothetical protein J1F01_06955 [Oscillospiraceae bacterium]|nr:hypothetical protein [Oscillospiraceae bacterium]